ncbi:MAG TPA: S46 family peptidase [Caulobacteraceae bacterium]|jgi:hypothetical protein|nr:S46 family peptidase [Caulobacteraceae bacterium]
MSKLALLGGLAALGLTGPALADEGMWTFDAIPQARVEQSLGVQLDQAWLDHLRLASVRLSSGCSAALVSHQGLALTNEHCLLGCAQSLSAPGLDHVADGFLTDSQKQERACPGLEAEVLVGITDATGEIYAASMRRTGADFVRAREQAIAAAERGQCKGDPRLRCQVIGFFGGGQFKVYKYRRYDDVRLVFAPEFQAAFFGGDAANFSFPRFALDCAFVRLYDRGRPAVTPQDLSWSQGRPRAGQAVFVSGNPGLTERAATAAELEADRDISLPLEGARLKQRQAALAAFAAHSREDARLAEEALFDAENAGKIVAGRLAALNSPGFLDERRAEEARLRARVAANPSLLAAVGDPWSEMAASARARAEREPAWRLLENQAGGGSQLYAWARMLVRAAEERTKAPSERLPEFAQSRLAIDRKAVLDARPADPGLERLLLSLWLARCQAVLGDGSPALATLLGGSTPAALADALAASGLAEPARRRALWRGGLSAVLASNDPMIVFVLRTDPMARAARRAFENEAIGPAQRASAAIAKARFALDGAEIYPDATFSLRLSWGRVEDSAKTSPFTSFGGLYARVDAADPLPPRWRTARTRLDPFTLLDFATTNDITGGNSGSPVVDAKGRLLGVAFDGNRASIAGDFAYDGATNRTVVVSTEAITEALDKVYDRKALLAELEGE